MCGIDIVVTFGFYRRVSCTFFASVDQKNIIRFLYVVKKNTFIFKNKVRNIQDNFKQDMHEPCDVCIESFFSRKSYFDVSIFVDCRSPV